MTSSFKDLIVWRKSMELVAEVYCVTEKFPSSEQYGLVSQMRRSAVSIPSNIAEGRYRGTKKDFAQFLRIANGSGAELETQIEIARRLDLVNDKDIAKLSSLLLETMKMLNVMIRKLNPLSYKANETNEAKS